MMSHQVTSEELAEMKCPRCGGTMSHGYIAGHWVRLRWTERDNTKTIFAGEPMRIKRDWWNAPSVEGMRCESCKIGIFRYGY